MCANSGENLAVTKIIDTQYNRFDLLPLDICGESFTCSYERDLLSALNAYLEDENHPDYCIYSALETFSTQHYGNFETAYIAASRFITKRERGLPCRVYINDAVYRFFESNDGGSDKHIHYALFVVDLLQCLDSYRRYGWNGKEETK